MKFSIYLNRRVFVMNALMVIPKLDVLIEGILQTKQMSYHSHLLIRGFYTLGIYRCFNNLTRETTLMTSICIFAVHRVHFEK